MDGRELDSFGDGFDVAVVCKRCADIGDFLMREQAQAAGVRNQCEALKPEMPVFS